MFYSFTEKALEKLADLGFSKEFGARPAKRAVQQYVINPLSVAILKNPDKKRLAVDTKQDGLTIS